MEEDEDVILEGSCLHEHLKETGFTDYEVISSLNNTNALMKDICSEKFMQTNEFSEKKNKIWSYIMELTSLITGRTIIENSLLDSINWSLVEAKVLVEEDLLILETLSPTMQKLSRAHLQGQTSSNETSAPYIFCNFSPNIFFTPYVWFFASLMVIAQYFYDRYLELSLLVVIFFVTAPILIRIFVVHQYKNYVSKFSDIVNTVQDVSQTTWKCLRFLNEVNIIKRGISPKSSELDLLECCYEKSLYEAFYSLLSLWRSHIHSSQQCLQCLKLDGVEGVHTLFSRRYEEGDLQEDAEQESAFSVCKGRRNEISQLSSAFLTEFLLCFEKSKYPRIFEVISSKELDSIRNKIDLLENILLLSRKVWLKQEPVLNSVASPPKSYEKLKVDVSGAVDTLSVKCRALAYSAIQLQEMVASCNSETDDISFEVVHQSCEDIKHKMLSCNASLEDVLERSENLLDRRECSLSNLFDHTTEDNYRARSTSAEECTIPSSLNSFTLDQINPVTEDEVFEAFAEHKSRLEEDKTLFESLRKERQMKKKQRERCRRVLQEIQPILQERRKMWEERETKAIYRMKQSKQDIENSPSESHSGDSGINSPVNNYPDLRMNKNLFSSASILTKCSISKPDTHMYPNDLDGEYDSEEERLLLYKRVRKDLDADEARRKKEEDDNDLDSEEEEREKKEISKKKSLFTLPLETLKLSVGHLTEHNDTQNVFKNGIYSENLCICDDDSKGSIPTIPHTFNDISKNECNIADSDVQNASITDQVEEDYSRIEFNVTVPVDMKEMSTRFKTDTVDHVEDNSYSCGESSGEEEEDRVLDWSTCGFRGRRSTEEGDVKVIPFAGVSTLLGSILKTTPQVGEEEVFGGVGEGESEVDDDDADEVDNELSNNS